MGWEERVDRLGNLVDITLIKMNKYANIYLKKLSGFLSFGNKPAPETFPEEKLTPELYQKKFLDSWPEPITDINNPELTWYESKEDPALLGMAQIYAEMMSRKPNKNFINDPEYFAEMIVNPYYSFAENYNKNQKEENQILEGYKTRDLRHMNPKQWKLFSEYMSQVDPDTFAL